VGRYFRLSESAKLIVGRNESENNMLTALAKDGDYLFGPATINGPTAVGKGRLSPEEIDAACRIVVRYCDRDGKLDADITYRHLPENDGKTVKACFMDDADIAKLRALASAA
jgi:predicted ribosome quality control (RQC) complex YloA/Tae2 family protein